MLSAETVVLADSSVDGLGAGAQSKTPGGAAFACSTLRHSLGIAEHLHQTKRLSKCKMPKISREYFHLHYAMFI